jgi:SWI/SNF-related matrix-associated actin-dependent regulator of chromatin subfamily A3
MKGGDLKKKEAMMQSFNNDEDVPVFLLNKTCGAVGLNLTVATHVFLLETNWDNTWESQAIGRAYRLGQTGPVKVMRYLCKGAVLVLLCG